MKGQQAAEASRQQVESRGVVRAPDDLEAEPTCAAAQAAWSP
jgi:hypothetical protein